MDRENFGFSCTVIAQLLVPKPTKEGYDEPSFESPRLFYSALPLGRWTCSGTFSCDANPGTSCCLHSVFEP